jgi:hypothetical protein
MVLSDAYSGSRCMGWSICHIDESEQAEAPKLKAIIGFV